MNPLTLHPIPGRGTEDVLVGPDGTVYTGVEGGEVFALDPATGSVRAVGNTGGRPLGLEWLPDGRLLVCDAHHGLLALDPTDGELETLVHEIGGVPMAFCNNAAVASDGTIWFSDSSTVFGIEQWRHDIAQNTCTGRLIRRDPDGSVEVVLDGLAFANGVALAADESFVAVAESAGRTVVRVWLGGERTGERDLLCADLPGYPDNIARGSDGLIWVSIPSTTDPLVERVLRLPRSLRVLVSKIPEALQPQVRRVVRAQAYGSDGALVHDVTAESEQFHMVTGLREHNGTLWLGSLEEAAVAAIPLAAD